MHHSFIKIPAGIVLLFLFCCNVSFSQTDLDRRFIKKGLEELSDDELREKIETQILSLKHKIDTTNSSFRKSAYSTGIARNYGILKYRDSVVYYMDLAFKYDQMLACKDYKRDFRIESFIDYHQQIDSLVNLYCN